LEIRSPSAAAFQLDPLESATPLDIKETIVRVKRILVALAGTVLALTAAAPAFADGALPKGVTRVTEVEGVTEYRLGNGLQVLLFPDNSKPTVTVNVTYHVGSRMEDYGETGMAHLLEHLLFKSSKSYKNIGQELSKRGMQFNGSTWFDRTNYFETFPTDPAAIDWALGMEAERMLQSSVSKADLDPEMTVVRNEMESGENNPFRILWQRMAAVAYEWHNYGKSTIGARADVENVNIPHLQAFYRKYYQPDNATLIVAGHFDAAHVLEQIATKFGALPKPTRVIDPTWTLDPVQDGERSVTLRRVGAEQIVAALYHTPAGAAADQAAFEVIDTALADTPNGRLHKRLVEAGKAKSLQSFAFGLAEPGYVLVGATLRPTDNLADAQKILLDTVEGLAKEPITEDELKRAKQQQANQFDQVMNDPQYFGIAISEAISQGDWRLLFFNRDRVKNLKLEDVNRVATTWLKPSNRTLGLFVPTDKPDRVPEPAKVDIAAVMKGFTPGKAIAAGEDFKATPQNIEARTQRSTLPSGAKLALLPKKTRGETVTVRVQMHFGNESNLKSKRVAASQVGPMLTRGTAKHTRAQIADMADALHMEWTVGGSTADGWADLNTKREHLADALKLLGEVLREPSFPADEFTQLKRQAIGQAEAASKEPQPIARKALSRHLDPYPADDARYTPTFDEQVKELDASKFEDVKAFYQHYWGANNAEIAVVGDFDPIAVKTQLGQLFGDWKSGADYARLPHPMSQAAATSLRAETPDKANAVASGTLPLPLKDTDPDYPALIAAAQVLGANQFDNRLIARLRIKDGLSYGAGGYLWASEFEPSGGLAFYAIYAPQNRAKVEAGFKEEIERFVRDGITADELASAKKSYASDRTDALANDRSEAYELTNGARIDRTFAYQGEQEKAVAALTVEQVNAAIKKWIKPGNVVWSLAGDFAKADKAAAAPAAK
jgi:zinc protease